MLEQTTFYYKKIIKLFFPVFISRIGLFTMSIIDAVMLAHYSSKHLSYHSIGDTPVIFIMLLIGGLVQGVLFITSEAYGKKDYPACGNALKQAVKQAILLGLIFMPLFLFAPQILSLFNYTPEEIKISGLVTQILGLSLPFVSVSIVTQFFLQGINKAWITSWFVLIANIMNFLLCYVFISGKFGAPELGAIGVALSTGSVRVFLCLSTLAYIFYHKENKKFFTKEKQNTKIQTINKTQQKLGYGATANMLSVETTNAFSVFFISTINLSMVGAYSLAYRLFIVTSLIPISFAVTCTILISSAIGQKKPQEIKNSIFYSLNINSFIMLIICSCGYLFAEKIAHLATNDSILAANTIPFLKTLAIALFFYGCYSILIISLRALYDLTIPSVIVFCSFTVFVPLGAFFCISEPFEIAYLLLISNLVSCIALFFRLIYVLYRKDFSKIYRYFN